jgi:hypothetical protein
MKTFLSIFLAILAAFIVMRVWTAYGMTAVFVALAIFLTLVIIVKMRHWYTGYHGYNQWPDPHGRYYNRWLKLKDEPLDYYPWLTRELRREGKPIWKGL